MNKKPLIGFEPMTYALPWRYSTTELKGPLDSISKCVATLQIKFLYISILSIYLFYLYIYIYAADSEKLVAHSVTEIIIYLR